MLIILHQSWNLNVFGYNQNISLLIICKHSSGEKMPFSPMDRKFVN